MEASESPAVTAAAAIAITAAMPDNSDLLTYFETVEKIKKRPSMDEYLEGYRRVREEYPFGSQVDKYRSSYNELRRLDKKRQSLTNNFMVELNSVSNSTARTAAKSSGNLDVLRFNRQTTMQPRCAGSSGAR